MHSVQILVLYTILLLKHPLLSQQSEILLIVFFWDDVMERRVYVIWFLLVLLWLNRFLNFFFFSLHYSFCTFLFRLLSSETMPYCTITPNSALLSTISVIGALNYQHIVFLHLEWIFFLCFFLLLFLRMGY